MRILANFALALALGAFVHASCFAQTTSRESRPVTESIGIAPGQITPTPEMWFYQQYMQQQQDPKFLIQQRAAFMSEQRRLRMASRAWYGISLARPWTTADLMYSDLAPRWTSGAMNYPNRWVARVPSTVVVVRPDATRLY